MYMRIFSVPDSICFSVVEIRLTACIFVLKISS